MSAPWWLWVVLLVGAPVLIALDLFVVPRGDPVPPRRAIWMTVLWTSIGLGFAALVWVAAGEKYAIKYVTGFVVEKGLDVEQVAAIVLALRVFEVPSVAVRRLVLLALSLGIGLRIPFALLGYQLAGTDHPAVRLALAGLLVGGGAIVLSTREGHRDPLEGPLLGIIARYLPFVHEYDGARFVVRRNGRRIFTLAAAVLAVILAADLYFAVIVPLAFAFEKPPFLVIASGTFALLGFRSLYYALEALRIDDRSLKTSIAVVLFVVAADLIVVANLEQPRWILPVALALVLAAPVVISVRRANRQA